MRRGPFVVSPSNHERTCDTTPEDERVDFLKEEQRKSVYHIKLKPDLPATKG